jgi:hypothetical protein
MTDAVGFGNSVLLDLPLRSYASFTGDIYVPIWIVHTRLMNLYDNS